MSDLKKRITQSPMIGAGLDPNRDDTDIVRFGLFNKMFGRDMLMPTSIEQREAFDRQREAAKKKAGLAK